MDNFILDDLFVGDLLTEMNGLRQNERQAGLRDAIHHLRPDVRFYNNLKTGKFNSRPAVCWENMNEFVNIPDATTPFSFTRHNGTIIQPGKMYTDGGSTPKILRGFEKFSSWGYAPAFILHDWIFTAHKCPDIPDQVGFHDAASILAEAMKTLMEIGYTNYNGEVVTIEKSIGMVGIMYLAVLTKIARNVWDNDKSVTCIVQ